MLPSVPPNATRRLAKDQPEYAQLSVADVAITNNPEIRQLQIGEFCMPGEAPLMQTTWELSPEELGVLMRGGKVVLSIVGRVHPPVHLGVMEREVPEGERYVCVTSGIGGFFAVLVAQTPDGPEPVQTGAGRYKTKYQAYDEAEIMASMFGVPFRKDA